MNIKALYSKLKCNDSSIQNNECAIFESVKALTVIFPKLQKADHNRRI